jgi:hypothetical protein
MSRFPEGFDVGGPVQAEVFIVWLNDDRFELTGPCGAAPWMIEVGVSEHPMGIVDRVIREVVGPPLLLHSTSWRQDRGAVILTFVAVIDAALVKAMESRPIGRAELARSEPTAAPAAIAQEQVVEHGLRHMAWLAQDDRVVAEALPDEWRTLLAAYVPEPFRHLD